jgi:hypothetical protein
VEAIQTMSVFKENPADPFRGGKEKHIVAKSSRPIRDGEAHALACDHAAAQMRRSVAKAVNQAKRFSQIGIFRTKVVPISRDNLMEDDA